MRITPGWVLYVPTYFHQSHFPSEFWILTINARSLLSGEKLKWLRQLVSSTTMVKVICITETWLDDKVPEEDIQIKGFKIVRKDRGRQGGGVAIYHRESVRIEQQFLGIKEECIWVKLYLPNGNPVLLGTYYRPPKDPRKTFYVNFIETLGEAVDKEDFVIVLGDLNIDLLAGGKTFRSLLTEAGLEQLVDQPTRETNTSSTLLDIVATTKPERITALDLMDKRSIKLDHYVLGVRIKSDPPAKRNT